MTNNVVCGLVRSRSEEDETELQYMLEGGSSGNG